MSIGRQVVETILLLAVLAGVVWTFYGVPDAGLRTLLGTVLVAGAMALTVRLARVDLRIDLRAEDEPWTGKRYLKRRYLRFRRAVDAFIEEARWLNRVAVDAERGFRTRQAAEEEMERIEARLAARLKELREVAGVEEEPEGVPAVEPPAVDRTPE